MLPKKTSPFTSPTATPLRRLSISNPLPSRRCRFSCPLLPPVTPSKIICVGRNYRDHAKELGNEVPAEPLLFFKPPSSLLAPGGVVRMPAASARVDFEGELALVIGRRTTKLAPGPNWRSVIRGYTLANDVTARDLQKKDAQWTRAKGFDTFCPVGPIVSDELDPDCRPHPRNPRQRRAPPARLDPRLHLFHPGIAHLHHSSHYP